MQCIKNKAGDTCTASRQGVGAGRQSSSSNMHALAPGGARVAAGISLPPDSRPTTHKHVSPRQHRFARVLKPKNTLLSF